jgi:hypothetical protein
MLIPHRRIISEMLLSESSRHVVLMQLPPLWPLYWAYMPLLRLDFSSTSVRWSRKVYRSKWLILLSLDTGLTNPGRSASRKQSVYPRSGLSKWLCDALGSESQSRRRPGNLPEQAELAAVGISLLWSQPDICMCETVGCLLALELETQAYMGEPAC